MTLTILGQLLIFVAGLCLSGSVFLSWYLNLRFRNLRNAVLEYGQQMRAQERRYDALARRHETLTNDVSRCRGMLDAHQATLVGLTGDAVAERPNPPNWAAGSGPPSQVDIVDETVTAWEHILREDTEG
jgi:hypothetical protein